MASFIVAGKRIDLPAVICDSTAKTRSGDAWQAGHYMTVRLLAPVLGIRVHTDGRSFPGRPSSNLQGAWIALGDVIETAPSLRDTRSLPGFFTHVAEATLSQHCVINIGRCSKIFDGQGGGFQAEHIGGPGVIFHELRGKVWHVFGGNA